MTLNLKGQLLLSLCLPLVFWSSSIHGAQKGWSKLSDIINSGYFGGSAARRSCNNSYASVDLKLQRRLFVEIQKLGTAIKSIMAFKTIPGRRKVKKIVHMLLNLLGLVLGVLGLYAIFTVIKKDGTIPDFLSLHSWVGFGTMCLYAIQFLLGFTFFLFPGGTMTMRANMKPWHFFFGLVNFILAIISAVTGIIRRFFFLGLRRGSEALVLNFTGVAIILFGISVILSVLLP